MKAPILLVSFLLVSCASDGVQQSQPGVQGKMVATTKIQCPARASTEMLMGTKMQIAIHQRMESPAAVTAMTTVVRALPANVKIAAITLTTTVTVLWVLVIRTA